MTRPAAHGTLRSRRWRSSWGVVLAALIILAVLAAAAGPATGQTEQAAP